LCNSTLRHGRRQTEFCAGKQLAGHHTPWPDGDTETADLIADNQIAVNSDWDQHKLRSRSTRSSPVGSHSSDFPNSNPIRNKISAQETTMRRLFIDSSTLTN